MKKITALILLIPLGAAAGDARDNMKPYPAPEAGFNRMVFNVPPAENDADRKIEIMAGKTMAADCNQTWLGGRLERKVAQGWGYPYFVLEASDIAASTRMACPPGEEKTERFVAVRGEGFLLRYNSKLPVVVYVPNGFEVRYRIWRADESIGKANSR